MQEAFRQSFPLEFAASLAMVLFSLWNLYDSATALHRIISLYILAAAFLLFALAVKRRQGAPKGVPEESSGLVKLLDKLSNSKPFGFVMLAISPLPLGFGITGVFLFLLLYIMSVNAMRVSDEELRSWVFVNKNE